MSIDQETCRRPAAAHGYDFFRSWLSDPFQVASITPSGRMLARRMALGIEPGSTVVELGAGTGTLTTAIRAAGVADGDLHMVEQNRRFADILQLRFPAANTVCADADAIAAVLPELVGQVDCIVSGLPILWFERDKKRAILEAAFRLLRPDGFLQQFTYLGRPPVGAALRAELGLTARLVAFAPLNLPPAFVYRFQRVGGD